MALKSRLFLVEIFLPASRKKIFRALPGKFLYETMQVKRLGAFFSTMYSTVGSSQLRDRLVVLRYISQGSNRTVFIFYRSHLYGALCTWSLLALACGSD